jgi:hypothetical protein
MNPQPSLQPTVLPTAPYSSRPPSPPYIHVPPPINPNLTPADNHNHNNPYNPYSTTGPNPASDIIMTIHPSASAIHTAALSPADLQTITRNLAQSASDASATWIYESRRRAQPVLDYLYLGPASVVKDRAFLLREGITMVLCARDARFAAAGTATAGGGMLVMGVKRAVEGMGVAVEGIDVADGRELVGAFSIAAGRVNAHVLGVERDGTGRRGKVLVVCETGNDRSAAVVAAYLMAVYGLDTVQAVQFMQLKRFCVALGDAFKFQLQTYGDILRARGDVGVMGLQARGGGEVGGTVKRRIEQTMGDAEEEGQGGDMVVEMDDERYASRGFAPFVERDY